MSDTISGIHTLSRAKKEYRYHPAKGVPYLPILYGSVGDLDIVFRSQEMILAEGIFDRIAIKRCFPDKAVFARLSKGTSGQLSVMVRRYVRKLWLAFDQDAAGVMGAEKAERRIKGEVEILRLAYPAKDPGEMLEKRGLARMQEVLGRQFRQSI